MMTVGIADVEIDQGSFQFTDRLSDSWFIDLLPSRDNSNVILRNFRFSHSLPYSGPPPRVRARATSGNDNGHNVLFDSCPGADPSWLGTTAPEAQTADSTDLFEVNLRAGYRFAGRHARNYLTNGEPWDPDLYEMLRKVKVWGGPFTVQPLWKPGPVLVTPTGRGSIAYSYRVTAVASGGETDPSEPVTTTNAPLSRSAYNTISWPLVKSATAYRVYGRTAGAERLLATVDASRGGPESLVWRDDGSAKPRTALHPENTTGRAELAGGVRPGALNGAGTSRSATVYSGAGVPADGFGGDGDYYLRTDAPDVPGQRIYVKAAGCWKGIL
jgi:hypothetical protein